MTQSHKQLIRQKIKEIEDLKRKGNTPESENRRRIAFLVEGISGDSFILRRATETIIIWQKKVLLIKMHAHGSLTDVILLDPSIAIHEKVDELLWSGCFYQEFQEIKKRIALVKIKLNFQLYRAKLSN